MIAIPATLADGAAFMARPDLFQELIAPWLAALSQGSDETLPFRAVRDDGGATLTLHRDPRTDLSILLLPDGLPLPDRVAATGRITFLRVLAGSATLMRWEAGSVAEDFAIGTARPLGPPIRTPLEPGVVAAVDGRQQAWRILTGLENAVVLKLVLTVGQALMLREYRLADGTLSNLIETDERAARGAMLLRVLRDMGRTDAVPAFAARSEHPAFFLRWQAMREWLALDANAAFPRLTEMARNDPHPEICAAARETLSLFEASCPA